MLPDIRVPGIEITSVTKPMAQHEYQCCWSHLPNIHMIPKGKQYVRVTYKDKRSGKFESDHICVSCWTAE